MAGWEERFLHDGGGVSPVTDPHYWRARAREARIIARLCEDDISASIMGGLADYYEGLAEKIDAD